MEKINQRLKKISEEKRLGIMTHLVLGYPTLKDSLAIVKTMLDCDVDFIELQIPFTDPMADGPTIMQANKVALDNGVQVKDAFEAGKQLSSQTPIPLLLMTYYNIVFNYGVEKFCKEAALAGFSGLIIPDIPVDEEPYDPFWKIADQENLCAMRFLSTSSNAERIQKVLDREGRFLYFIGQKGTTGARANLNEELSSHIQKIRDSKKASIAVGFGISKPEHLKELKAAGADVAIIGSAVINTYNQASPEKKLDELKKYLKTLIQACS